MRLGIVRQRYTPFGGAERFVERAIAALQERGVKVSVYTRSWPGSSTDGVEPIICNPYYIGGVWRDAGFDLSALGTYNFFPRTKVKVLPAWLRRSALFALAFEAVDTSVGDLLAPFRTN